MLQFEIKKLESQKVFFLLCLSVALEKAGVGGGGWWGW